MKVNEPIKIILDFEMAMFNGINSVFSKGSLNGCLFHLGQIIWRRVQHLGFVNEYKNKFNFKLNVKMIVCLSFVSKEKIMKYFYILKTKMVKQKEANELAILMWFEKNFLSINYCKNKQYDFWGVHDRVLNEICRTTNSLEGYHRHINALISSKHHDIKKNIA
jgi:hypothetical protein